MKTLVIGSTVVDMIVNVNQLPTLEEDVHTTALSMNMGGMAYNVYQILEMFKQDAILASPVGTGRFADIMLEFYKERNIEPFVRLDIDNGLCLCLVDETGERTFISHHGAEYLFDKSWYEDIDFDEIGNIYISGLEVEEKTGEQLVEFLEEKNKKILFAPGPRALKIDGKLFRRIIRLHPILHLNKAEALMISNKTTVESAAEYLYSKTQEAVIVTLGAKGCYVKEKNGSYLIQGFKTEVVDTIGAGDSHAGAILTGLSKGYSLKKSVALANLVSAKVVSTVGAGLTKQKYLEILNVIK